MNLRILLCFALTLACLRSASCQTIPRPDHVLIVIEENKAFSQIIGNSQAPYINYLAGIGANFTQSFAITHPSEPNYLAFFSGSEKTAPSKCSTTDW